MLRLLFLLAIVLALVPIGAGQGGKNSSASPNREKVESMIARFARTEIRVNTASLSRGDGKALARLIQASRILNFVFMDQLWSGDRALYAKLRSDMTPLGRARLHYFWINKGPWDHLGNHQSFVPGAPSRKPPGANFYPADMSKQEFEAWEKALPETERQLATGFFTVIRRDAARRLIIVPYSQAYAAELQKVAALLREAASLTENPSLKRFLSSRADALGSNDYYQSDIDWMDLDAPIDITIGPYETYTDELFGYKAAFEAYVSLRDEAESSKIAAFAGHLQEIENNLPEDPKYRNPKLGASAPIRVVNEVLSTGDGAHGIQTAAYNLPNDEHVVQQKGSKRVMLKNVQEAKFRTILVPIARQTLVAEQRGDVNFDQFFTHILAHELMHGLGPHQIVIPGRQSSPRKELKEIYGAIEEAKADASGLFALQYMMEHSDQMALTRVLKSDETAQRQLYVTFLASAFRSLRFGLGEAHGKGMALQVNYLLDKGGFVARSDGTFAVDMARIKPAVRDLVHDLLTVEATGDYAGAKEMLDTLGVIRPEVQRTLDNLKTIPVDIEPVFVTADEIAPDTTGPKW